MKKIANSPASSMVFTDDLRSSVVKPQTVKPVAWGAGLSEAENSVLGVRRRSQKAQR